MNYKARYLMPRSFENAYYNFTVGPAQFIAFSTEMYFSWENGSLAKVQQQKQWLDKVLSEANRPEVRAKYPWIIAFGHRSLYCSTTDWDCIRGMTTDVRNESKNKHVICILVHQ